MQNTHFIRCQDLTKLQLEEILQLAESYKRGTIEVPLFFGQKPAPSVALVFLEDSTRTKLSFELAAKKLGFHSLDFMAKSSSLNKGETLLDSLKCLQAMGVNTCVVRQEDCGLTELASQVGMSLVSAGEGVDSHPSQALLDYMTWREREPNLESKKLLIAGDIKHSRVAASHFEMAAHFGVEILLAGPDDWIPADRKSQQVDWEQGLKNCDAVMMLRVQKERHKLAKQLDNYNSEFGLNKENLKILKKDALIFHPGPFNLDVEVTNEVLTDPRCQIWQQVENGIYARQAILQYTLGVGL